MMVGPFTDEDRVESLKAALLSGTAAGAMAAVLLLAHRVPTLGGWATLASIAAGLSGSTVWVSAAIAGLSGGLKGDKGTQRHTAQDFETIEGTKK